MNLTWYLTSGTPPFDPDCPPPPPGTPAPAKLRAAPVGTQPAALVLELSFCSTLCLMSSPFQMMSSSQLACVTMRNASSGKEISEEEEEDDLGQAICGLDSGLQRNKVQN